MTDQDQAASLRATQASTTDNPGYPGADLGLPEAGRGSIAGMGRRIGALLIDWLLCTFIVVALIRPGQAGVEYWTLAIFAIEDLVLTALTGLTVGKRIMGIRVVRLDGRMVGAWGLVRTGLLLAAVPPLIVDRNLRGLHDRAANTAVVRL
ncbi:MAG TPA: RDD family protein [Streptosporangiaceae bacterium]